MNFDDFPLRELLPACATAHETNKGTANDREKKGKLVEALTVMNTNVFVRDLNSPFTDSEAIFLPSALHTLWLCDL